ncbi:unnamed protein product [Paramecium pentaurelia]|uniref:Uncharacterized protein n=1 Tax=Paramecium pentaurelia TaxID=43138 RepID=A0A8S1UHN5_9CILI|nr:unnamed protein product [Paramecium pentaurelia]
MGLISYYCLLVVVFIGLIIYDLLFYTTYQNDVCPPIEYTDAAADETTADENAAGNRILNLMTENIDEFINSQNAAQDETTDETTTDETTTDETATDEAATSSSAFANKLVTLPFIIILLYCGVIGLIILAMLGIYCFGKMPSERFGNLNMCWACLGIYVRNFAVLTRLLSWVGILLMAIHAIITITDEECQAAIHEYKQNKKIYRVEGAMYDSSILLILVNLCFWGATHCILPSLKLFIDAESFLYEPFDRTKGLAYWFCCIMLGP